MFNWLIDRLLNMTEVQWIISFCIAIMIELVSIGIKLDDIKKKLKDDKNV